jgi:hypothetical protein
MLFVDTFVFVVKLNWNDPCMILKNEINLVIGTAELEIR